ncbi:MAG: hypothetical protein RLZZ293_601, partial [Pseudomonadota bacterium]
MSDIDLSMTHFATFYRGNIFKGYTADSDFFSGGFCATFKLSQNNQHYAYRVPHKTNPNAEYQKKVIKWFNQIQSNYFVEFGEEAKSLLVNGQFLDVTYMEWIEGLTLGDYIQDNYRNKVLISNLAKNFLDLIVWLHQNKISHGDLNDSNIMVRPNGSLVLIDYDTLCFSSIEGKYPELSNGKANYQHPSRMQGQGNKLSLQADYFSELVIYLSVLALAENPNLFNYVSVGDSLLFKKEDFVDFQQSKIYSELIKLSNEIIELTALLLNCCQTSNYLTLRFLPDYYTLKQLSNEINAHQNSVANLANAQKQLSAQINNFTQQFNQINHQYQQVIVNPNLNSALHDLSNLTKNCQTIQNQINQAQTDAKQNANKGNLLVQQIQQLDLNINVNHQTLRQELLNLQQLKNKLVSNINLTSIQQQEQQLKQLAIDYNRSYGSFASTSLFFQQLDQLIKQINTHQNTITNLANAQKQLNTQISNSTQQVVQLNQKCQQSSSKLSHNSKELDILKQEFTSLKQEFNQIKINQLVQEDNQLKRQQNDLFQQISTLTPQVDHLVKSVTVASLIALPTQLTSQIDQIFTKYKNITIYDQQLDPSLRNLIDLSQDTENLINQFFNDYPQLLILVGQINTYNSSVTILNKELAGQLTYEYNKLTNEASDIRTKRLQAVAEWKANQNQLNTIDKKIQDLHYQIQQTAGKSASLTSQIHPLSQQNYVLIQQVNQSISNETLLTADKDNLSLTQQKLTQELDQLTKLAQENTQWWNNGGEKNIQILQQKVSKFNPVNNPVTYLQQLDKKRQKLIHSKLTDWLYCLFNLINLVVI